jgi:hypothetical protein
MKDRTENDVRNRFNSLIGKKSGKRRPVEDVIASLEKCVQESELRPEDEFPLNFDDTEVDVESSTHSNTNNTNPCDIELELGLSFLADY